MDFSFGYSRRWLTRLGKSRAALKTNFNSLSVGIVRGIEIAIPLGAHRSYWTGTFADADLVDFLARMLPNDGLFLDVGANIGLYSAALFKLRGSIRATAFEPVPTTHALLKSTFSLNKVPFESEGVGVSDRAGSLILSAYEHGMNNFWIKQDDGRHPTLEVPTITLDEWCGNNPRRVPSAVKIDVEGHEWAVIRGARHTLHTYRPTLVIECHAADWDKLEVSRSDFEAEIRAVGYRRICDRNGRDIDFANSRETFHLLALP